MPEQLPLADRPHWRRIQLLGQPPTAAKSSGSIFISFWSFWNLFISTNKRPLRIQIPSQKSFDVNKIRSFEEQCKLTTESFESNLLVAEKQIKRRAFQSSSAQATSLERIQESAIEEKIKTEHCDDPLISWGCASAQVWATKHHPQRCVSHTTVYYSYVLFSQHLPPVFASTICGIAMSQFVPLLWVRPRFLVAIPLLHIVVGLPSDSRRAKSHFVHCPLKIDLSLRRVRNILAPGRAHELGTAGQAGYCGFERAKSLLWAIFGPLAVFSAIPRAQDALPPFHPRPARDRFVGARLSQRFQEGFSLWEVSVFVCVHVNVFVFVCVCIPVYGWWVQVSVWCVYLPVVWPSLIPLSYLGSRLGATFPQVWSGITRLFDDKHFRWRNLLCAKVLYSRR